MARFAGLYNYLPHESLANIWIENLANVPEETLLAAFQRVGHTFIPTSACPFPTPAHVREQIRTAESAVKDQIAAESWEMGMNWMGRWFHPDIGIDKKAPALDSKIMRSLNQAGGFSYLYNADRTQIMWARKTFIEAFQTLDKIEAEHPMLTGSEAKRALDRVRDGIADARPKLPAAPQSGANQPVAPAPVVTVSVPSGIFVRKPTITAELTPGELEARRAHLKQQLKEILDRESLKNKEIAT